MTLITKTLPSLDDERLALMAEIARSWAGPTVYSTLVPDEQGKIDAALDRLDAGQGIPSEEVFAKLADRLKAAGA